MKREELFNRTVGVLVDAYQNNKLEHQQCKACAVGNIVACSSVHEHLHMAWFHLVNMYRSNDKYDLLSVYAKDVANLEEMTGYSIAELDRIEAAFEGVQQSDELMTKIELAANEDTPEGWARYDELLLIRDAIDVDGVLGLRAVYDVLCDIHEVDMLKVATSEEVFADKFASVD